MRKRHHDNHIIFVEFVGIAAMRAGDDCAISIHSLLLPKEHQDRRSPREQAHQFVSNQNHSYQ